MPVTAAAAQNLLSTFTDLQRSVQTTVQVHAGNEVKLDIKRGHVLRFLAVLNQHCSTLHEHQDARIRHELGMMIERRAQTIVNLFHRARARHSTPSRVCGDHGVENILVAAAMEDIRGSDWGSYIWGQSIHNTRIEQLWYDVTSGFGHKWKLFFLGLEHNDGLDLSMPAHIWLLQYLFMESINNDANRWAAAWNLHNMQIKHERARSPTNMYAFGMLQLGPRGLDL